MTKLIDLKSRVTGNNLMVAMGPLVAQSLAWGYFLSIKRESADSVLIIVVVFVGATSIYFTTRIALLKHGIAWHLAISLLNTFVLLIVYFSILYWSYGTKENFNVTLSRIDAIY